MALLREKLGIVAKIEDGGDRAIPPSIVSILRQMDVLSGDQARELERHREPAIRNRKEEKVGSIIPCFTLERSTG